MLKRSQHEVRLLNGAGSDNEEGEDLCDCEFSLAYGGRILLSAAKLRLKRGGRYGLCGPNGAGKTTLMKAIANGQVDGFPDRREVCKHFTIYTRGLVKYATAWIYQSWGAHKNFAFPEICPFAMLSSESLGHSWEGRRAET